MTDPTLARRIIAAQYLDAMAEGDEMRQAVRRKYDVDPEFHALVHIASEREVGLRAELAGVTAERDRLAANAAMDLRPSVQAWNALVEQKLAAEAALVDARRDAATTAYEIARDWANNWDDTGNTRRKLDKWIKRASMLATPEKPTDESIATWDSAGVPKRVDVPLPPRSVERGDSTIPTRVVGGVLEVMPGPEKPEAGWEGNKYRPNASPPGGLPGESQDEGVK